MILVTCVTINQYYVKESKFLGTLRARYGIYFRVYVDSKPAIRHF
jgi:hypothetical protein